MKRRLFDNESHYTGEAAALSDKLELALMSILEESPSFCADVDLRDLSIVLGGAADIVSARLMARREAHSIMPWLPPSQPSKKI